MYVKLVLTNCHPISAGVQPTRPSFYPRGEGTEASSGTQTEVS